MTVQSGLYFSLLAMLLLLLSIVCQKGAEGGPAEGRQLVNMTQKSSGPRGFWKHI